MWGSSHGLWYSSCLFQLGFPGLPTSFPLSICCPHRNFHLFKLPVLAPLASGKSRGAVRQREMKGVFGICSAKNQSPYNVFNHASYRGPYIKPQLPFILSQKYELNFLKSGEQSNSPLFPGVYVNKVGVSQTSSSIMRFPLEVENWILSLD